MMASQLVDMVRDSADNGGAIARLQAEYGVDNVTVSMHHWVYPDYDDQSHAAADFEQLRKIPLSDDVTDVIVTVSKQIRIPISALKD
jgi:hypothetical protein